MHRFTVLFFLTLTLQLKAQTNCERYSDDHIPNDLNDAINYLNCVWSDTSKIDFKNKPENDAVAELHFGTGRSIRNNWGLWNQKSTLYSFFKSKGIFHPDDMSAIILTSFHRTLNDREIQLDQQIAEYKEYWENMKIQVENQKEIYRKEYKKFNIGDTVLLNFNIGTINITDENNPYAYLQAVAKGTEADDEKNCIVEGVIKKKKGSNAGAYYVQIEIIDICDYEYKLYCQSCSRVKPRTVNKRKLLRQEISESDEPNYLEIGSLIVFNMSAYNIEKK